MFQQSRTFRESYIIQISLQGLWEVRALSKILRHYCPGTLFPFPSEGKMCWLASSTGMLKNAQKSITVKNLLPVGTDTSSAWGLGATGCQGITMFLLLREPGQTSNLDSWDFSQAKLEGLGWGIIRPELYNLWRALYLDGPFHLWDAG